MTTFPRRGTELTTNAALTFPDVKWERLGTVTTFENGWFESSAIGLGGRYKEIPLVAIVNATDMATIFAFLVARDLFVEAFSLVHPRLGTITVNYVGTELPLPMAVDGNPPLYRLAMTFQGQF